MDFTFYSFGTTAMPEKEKKDLNGKRIYLSIYIYCTDECSSILECSYKLIPLHIVKLFGGFLNCSVRSMILKMQTTVPFRTKWRFTLIFVIFLSLYLCFILYFASLTCLYIYRIAEYVSSNFKFRK